MNELLREKEELAAERDAQLAQISELRADTSAYLAKLKAKETERLAASGEIQTLKESIQSKKAEQARATGWGGARAWGGGELRGLTKGGGKERMMPRIQHCGAVPPDRDHQRRRRVIVSAARARAGAGGEAT